MKQSALGILLLGLMGSGLLVSWFGRRFIGVPQRCLTRAPIPIRTPILQYLAGNFDVNYPFHGKNQIVTA